MSIKSVSVFIGCQQMLCFCKHFVNPLQLTHGNKEQSVMQPIQGDDDILFIAGNIV